MVHAVVEVAASLAAKLAGDRSAVIGHLGAALRLVRTAADPALEAWIRVHHSAVLSDAARYAEAAGEADLAVELAGTVGHQPVLALALAAAGTALARTGRLDEATSRYEQSISLCQRIGSQQVAFPLVRLGDLHLLRGRVSLARAAYEEAVRIAEAYRNVRALVPALAGLARVVAERDPRAARALAERAVELARGPDLTAARCALGRALLAAADPAGAVRVAEHAADQARRHHDPAGLAEALRLCATGTDDPRLARAALVEAVAILRAAQAPVDVDQVIVQLGRRPGASTAERVEARVAADRLAAVGVPVSESGPADAVVIHTLGRFEVLVGGEPVPEPAWQSRKARHLLRILVTRRGRPAGREELAELLWPGSDPDRARHRLSVLLSTLRAVLDPRRRAPADRYVLSSRTAVALDLENLHLDVELFRGEAVHGLRLFDQGESDAARGALVLAERRYRGDFLLDQPYDDWAVPVRDEARRLYLRVVLALAAIARRRNDLEEAAEHLRRALRTEPYDEGAHRELIAVLTEAGRHGEAEQAYARYGRAMAAIGVPLRPVSRLTVGPE
ncbi:BTAD domain-containing putative transcriptional regulator [Micromonospora zhanjiangensis]